MDKPVHCAERQIIEIAQPAVSVQNAQRQEAIVAAFAYGAASVRFLLRAKPLHDIAGLSQTIAMAEAILSGLGFSGRRVATIETDDPDSLGEVLRGIEPAVTVKPPATFRTVGKRRDLLRFA